MRARDARRFLRLEPRVLQVRARRRLERHDELGAVVFGEEAGADGAHRRHDLRQGIDEHARADHDHADRARHWQPLLVDAKHDDGDADERGARVPSRRQSDSSERREEGADRDRHHRRAVIERPRDDLACSSAPAVEPVVELVELLRDPPLLVSRLVRIRPVRRQHRVERERDEQRHEHGDAIVSANGLNHWPPTPGMKPIGMNTARIENVVAATASPISSVPSRAAV